MCTRLLNTRSKLQSKLRLRSSLNRMGAPQMALLIAVALSACSKAVGTRHESYAGPTLNTSDSDVSPQNPDTAVPSIESAQVINNGVEIENTLSSQAILTDIHGKWISACQVRTGGIKRSDSEKYVIDIQDSTIALHILKFMGSSSCKTKNYKDKESMLFTTKIGSGDKARNRAFAADIVDTSSKIETPLNVLEVFATDSTPNPKERSILLEVFDEVRLGLRLNIEEWKPFLNDALECHDGWLNALKLKKNASLLGDKDANRYVFYTNTNAFTRVNDQELLDILK